MNDNLPELCKGCEMFLDGWTKLPEEDGADLYESRCGHCGYLNRYVVNDYDYGELGEPATTERFK